MNREIKCPYCKKKPKWVDNKVIYGRSYGKSHMCYYCKPCDAYVGCHENTRRPLGTLANSANREYRQRAHRAIDPLWKEGILTRKEVYIELAKAMNLREVHIGSSDIETCKKIIKISVMLKKP